MPNFKLPKQIQSFCKSESSLLFILALVLRCLFLLSLQCHRIGRGGKEYRESTLGLHGRSDYAIFIILFTVYQHSYF